MKTWAVMPLLVVFLVLAIACGSDAPTNAATPQSADQIKKAGQKLFDAWLEAIEERDGQAIHVLLKQEIRSLCTTEEMQQFLGFDIDHSDSPDAEVKQVFLDPENPQEAVMVLEVSIEPRPGRESTDATSIQVVYPIFLEDNRWHLGFSFPFVPIEDRCPFTAGFSSQEPIQVTPTPAVLQSTEEIEKAAVELWDDWVEATRAHDASAFYSLLGRNITDRCTLEQMERFFEMDDDAFTFPEMDVKEVFAAPGNSENAFMTMELRDEPADSEQGLRDAYVASIPYPIVREDGRWRMVIQLIIVGDGCPFVGSFSSQEAVPAESSSTTSP